MGTWKDIAAECPDCGFRMTTVSIEIPAARKFNFTCHECQCPFHISTEGKVVKGRSAPPEQMHHIRTG